MPETAPGEIASALMGGNEESAEIFQLKSAPILLNAEQRKNPAAAQFFCRICLLQFLQSFAHPE